MTRAKSTGSVQRRTAHAVASIALSGLRLWLARMALTSAVRAARSEKGSGGPVTSQSATKMARRIDGRILAKSNPCCAVRRRRNTWRTPSTAV